MDKQKTRCEIDINYTWDLTKIFKNNNEFYNSLEDLETKINDILKFKGNILKGSNNLLEYFRTSEKIERSLYKLYYYAHLNYDSDTTDKTSQELLGKIENLLKEYSKLSSYVIPELMQKDYSLIEKYIKENKELEDYKFYLENLYRYKEYTLGEKEEKILSILSKSLDNASEIYESLTDSDMTFGNITYNGKTFELTESNYTSYIKSNDRSLRKLVFERLFETYSNNKYTITNTFKGNIDTLTSIAKIRGYNSSIEASLFNDNIDISVYKNLIDTVNKNMDVIYKYYNLKKDILKLDDMHMYDIYVPMIDNLDKEYSFLDAKNIVIDALSILGEDYINNLKKAFDEKWIDVYNNRGKRSGAYSSGFYDTNPYILLNYESKYHDISTLAHELGHSMHTYYSCHNNSYINSSYQIFVAEVASTVNELILAKYLINNSKSKEEKLFILNELMELFKSTIYRQTMFAEFELKMHSDYENGIILTNDYISDSYYNLVKKYFGDSVIIDDLIKYEWERIPHFYYNFYVYKYAIGLSCACKIYKNITCDNGLEDYLNFLKLGGSAYPFDELMVAKVDLNGDVIESAITMFNEIMDEFIELYNK